MSYLVECSLLKYLLYSSARYNLLAISLTGQIPETIQREKKWHWFFSAKWPTPHLLDCCVLWLLKIPPTLQTQCRSILENARKDPMQPSLQNTNQKCPLYSKCNTGFQADLLLKNCQFDNPCDDLTQCTLGTLNRFTSHVICSSSQRFRHKIVASQPEGNSTH